MLFAQNKKKLYLLLFGFGIITCIYIIYILTSLKHQPNELKLSELEANTKTILYWTPMFNQADYYFGFGSDIFKNCTYKNCYATSNKNQLPVDKFDAILFHGPEYCEEKFGKPDKREPNQVYIFFNQESPLNTRSFYKNYNNFYNWTMTYRLDSDIIHRYGIVESATTNYQPPTVKEIQQRPKKIAWFVSNCNTPSKRERVFNELKQYMPIDVYGKCGNYTCSENEDCYGMIENKYKFYLSFENSICEDYVTEKLYNILKKNLVPMVYSGADYNKVAPPNSVIDVMNFTSAKNLAKYINYLDTHPKEYLKFFEWKENYVIKTSNKIGFCTLCERLNGHIEPKTYSDIVTWWAGEKFGKCINGSTFCTKINVLMFTIFVVSLTF